MTYIETTIIQNKINKILLAQLEGDAFEEMKKLVGYYEQEIKSTIELKNEAIVAKNESDVKLEEMAKNYEIMRQKHPVILPDIGRTERS